MLGSIYALIALGYTMVYGILRIINFAHGDILMVGALTTLSAMNALNTTFPHMPQLLQLGVALMIAMAVCALLAMAVERFAYRRLRNAPRLAPLISGIGVSVLLQTVAMIIWTRNPLMFPHITLTCAIGGAFAALAGVMMASNYGNASFSMGFLPGIKAFTAAVLGGIGNIRGAMIGGILLGIIEALGAGYLGELTHGVFGSNYQDVFAFMVLILVLVFRPAGLLGERVANRA